MSDQQTQSLLMATESAKALYENLKASAPDIVTLATKSEDQSPIIVVWFRSRAPINVPDFFNGYKVRIEKQPLIKADCAFG